jgi:hypothetical protein
MLLSGGRSSIPARPDCTVATTASRAQGGYRAATATSDRHAARLAIQSMSDPSEYSLLIGAGGSASSERRSGSSVRDAVCQGGVWRLSSLPVFPCEQRS